MTETQIYSGKVSGFLLEEGKLSQVRYNSVESQGLILAAGL